MHCLPDEVSFAKRNEDRAAGFGLWSRDNFHVVEETDLEVAGGELKQAGIAQPAVSLPGDDDWFAPASAIVVREGK